MNATVFVNEKAFLNRKLLTTKVEWEVLPALSQLISPPLADQEAKDIVGQLKDALGKQAAVVFHKMIFTMNSKLRGGLRVVVSVALLREFFAAEIDGFGGGGGRGLNPKSSPSPSPRGAR